MSTKIFRKTLIIGLGLIGGSFARSCRIHNISEEIYASDSDSDSISLAKKYDVIDGDVFLDEDLSDFDLIVLATPLSTYKDIINEIAPRVAPKTILIELGSVKESKIQNKILPENLRGNFVPCHPIAGSQESGFENSSDDLFSGKKFIICPKNTNDNVLKTIETVAKAIGAEVEFLDAKKHNEIYALVSHLPQFLSFLTAEFSPKDITDNFFKNAFRLDNSNPEIWGEIFQKNEKAMEKFYLEFFDNLEEFEDKIEERKFSKLLQDMDFAKSDKIAFDEEYLEENFVSIFFRIIFIVSYLKISDVKTFEKYSGPGFKDFTSMTTILNLDTERLITLLTKNRQKILRLFEYLSEDLSEIE